MRNRQTDRQTERAGFPRGELFRWPRPRVPPPVFIPSAPLPGICSRRTLIGHHVCFADRGVRRGLEAAPPAFQEHPFLGAETREEPQPTRRGRAAGGLITPKEDESSSRGTAGRQQTTGPRNSASWRETQGRARGLVQSAASSPARGPGRCGCRRRGCRSFAAP